MSNANTCDHGRVAQTRSMVWPRLSVPYINIEDP